MSDSMQSMHYGDGRLMQLNLYTEKVVLQEGRYSIVSSAWHGPTSQSVVLKAYRKAALKPWHMPNIQREIALLHSISNRCAGVVGLLAAFEDSQHVYLVFRACMRGDLYQLLRKQPGGTMTEQLVATSVVMPLLVTLAELHAMHVVHRDVKPENVFVDMEGRVLLGDFGLAACTDSGEFCPIGAAGKPGCWDRVGTLDYMAPEVLSMPTPGDVQAGKCQPKLKPYDEKVDVWAIGCLCYELLVGKPPFEVEDPAETARLILAGKPAPLPAHMSPSCHAFVRQALSFKPQERPAAHELLQHAWIQEQMLALPNCSRASSMAGNEVACQANSMSCYGRQGYVPNSGWSCGSSKGGSPRRRDQPSLQDIWRCMFSGQLAKLHEQQQARERASGEVHHDENMIASDDQSGDTLQRRMHPGSDEYMGATFGDLVNAMVKANASSSSVNCMEYISDVSGDEDDSVENVRASLRRRSNTSQFFMHTPLLVPEMQSSPPGLSPFMGAVNIQSSKSEASLTRPPGIPLYRQSSSCNGASTPISEKTQNQPTQPPADSTGVPSMAWQAGSLSAVKKAVGKSRFAR